MIEWYFPKICSGDLTPERLAGTVYPDTETRYYWSDDWSPEFYGALARAGFISISHPDADLGLCLLPEMQQAYAVLDWDNLHIPRAVRRLIGRGGLVCGDYSLRLTRDPAAVIDGIDRAYPDRNWMTGCYRDLMVRMARAWTGDPRIAAVELREGTSGALIGGEIGYSIGRTWTSLSGFLDRREPAWNHLGTLQLVALAGLLLRRGYAFWNLGHPYMQYKLDLGARILPRADFLMRWFAAHDGCPAAPLGARDGETMAVLELLEAPQRGSRETPGPE
jgi:hypothetical protein